MKLQDPALLEDNLDAVAGSCWKIIQMKLLEDNSDEVAGNGSVIIGR